MTNEHNDLLGNVNEATKEAKFNMFRYQDHLLRILGIISDCFYERNYPNAFEELQNLYADTNGFFDNIERKELDELYEKAYNENVKYISYNISFQSITRNVKNQTYQPPTGLYQALIRFRFKLMAALCKKQLLIPQIKKGHGGAAHG